MKKMRIKNVLLVLAASTFLLASCGGGGSSQPVDETTDPAETTQQDTTAPSIVSITKRIAALDAATESLTFEVTVTADEAISALKLTGEIRYPDFVEAAALTLSAPVETMNFSCAISESDSSVALCTYTYDMSGTTTPLFDIALTVSELEDTSENTLEGTQTLIFSGVDDECDLEEWTDSIWQFESEHCTKTMDNGSYLLTPESGFEFAGCMFNLGFSDESDEVDFAVSVHMSDNNISAITGTSEDMAMAGGFLSIENNQEEGGHNNYDALFLGKMALDGQNLETFLAAAARSADETISLFVPAQEQWPNPIPTSDAYLCIVKNGQDMNRYISFDGITYQEINSSNMQHVDGPVTNVNEPLNGTTNKREISLSVITQLEHTGYSAKLDYIRFRFTDIQGDASDCPTL